MSHLCECAIAAYFRIFRDYMVRIFFLKIPHMSDMPIWRMDRDSSVGIVNSNIDAV